MQTIGERLEEARKKRGVTIEEAAKETKIREEYLERLETTSGRDIPLEGIYIRGYIRNYAKFLRIDAGRLLADFDAGDAVREESNTVPTPKAQKELIGRLEISTDAPPAPTLGKNDNPTVVENAKNSKFDAPRRLLGKILSLPSWVWPVAAGFLGVLILAGVVSAVSSMAKSKKEAPQTVTASEIKLIALGDEVLIVKQTSDEKTLFAGSMKKGEEKALTRTGPVRVQYSEGNLLEVEKDGKRYKMGAAGTGKRLVD